MELSQLTTQEIVQNAASTTSTTTPNDDTSEEEVDLNDFIQELQNVAAEIEDDEDVEPPEEEIGDETTTGEPAKKKYKFRDRR